jgi:hypothetical protein
MSHNRKVLRTATNELGKAKAPAKPKDIIVDPMGQWKYPGQNTRIPGSDITMQGVNYPVFAQPNVGQPQMMYPGQEYQFPGAAYVDEFPQGNNEEYYEGDYTEEEIEAFKAGGYVVEDISVPSLTQAKKGGSLKKYSKNIEATNKLLRKSELLKKLKSKKKKIFDPSSSYFDVGGIPNLPLREGRVAYERLGYTDNDRMAMAEEGGYLPKAQLAGSVTNDIGYRTATEALQSLIKQKNNDLTYAKTATQKAQINKQYEKLIADATSRQGVANTNATKNIITKKPSGQSIMNMPVADAKKVLAQQEALRKKNELLAKQKAEAARQLALKKQLSATNYANAEKVIAENKKGFAEYNAANPNYDLPSSLVSESTNINPGYLPIGQSVFNNRQNKVNENYKVAEKEKEFNKYLRDRRDKTQSYNESVLKSKGDVTGSHYNEALRAEETSDMEPERINMGEMYEPNKIGSFSNFQNQNPTGYDPKTGLYHTDKGTYNAKTKEYTPNPVKYKGSGSIKDEFGRMATIGYGSAKLAPLLPEIYNFTMNAPAVIGGKSIPWLTAGNVLGATSIAGGAEDFVTETIPSMGKAINTNKGEDWLDVSKNVIDNSFKLSPIINKLAPLKKYKDQYTMLKHGYHDLDPKGGDKTYHTGKTLMAGLKLLNRKKGGAIEMEIDDDMIQYLLSQGYDIEDID